MSGRQRGHLERTNEWGIKRRRWKPQQKHLKSMIEIAVQHLYLCSRKLDVFFLGWWGGVIEDWRDHVKLRVTLCWYFSSMRTHSSQKRGNGPRDENKILPQKIAVFFLQSPKVKMSDQLMCSPLMITHRKSMLFYGPVSHWHVIFHPRICCLPKKEKRKKAEQSREGDPSLHNQIFLMSVLCRQQLAGLHERRAKHKHAAWRSPRVTGVTQVGARRQRLKHSPLSSWINWKVF